MSADGSIYIWLEIQRVAERLGLQRQDDAVLRDVTLGQERGEQIGRATREPIGEVGAPCP